MNTWDTHYASGKGFAPLNEIYLDRLLDELARLLGKKPTEFLDLGCGDGDAIVKFAGRGIRSDGVDCSKEGLRIANIKAHTQGIQDRVTFITHDIEDFTVAKKYPVIFCRLTIAFVKDRRMFVARVKTMLDIPGAFVLITPVTYTALRYAKTDKPGIAVDHDDLLSLLQSNFDEVIDWHHEYFADRGETITFVCIKR